MYVILLSGESKEGLSQEVVSSLHNAMALYGSGGLIMAYSEGSCLLRLVYQWVADEGHYRYKILFSNQNGTWEKARCTDFCLAMEIFISVFYQVSNEPEESSQWFE